MFPISSSLLVVKVWEESTLKQGFSAVQGVSTPNSHTVQGSAMYSDLGKDSMKVNPC